MKGGPKSRFTLEQKVTADHFLSLRELSQAIGMRPNTLCDIAKDETFPFFDRVKYRKVRMSDFNSWYRSRLSLSSDKVPVPAMVPDRQPTHADKRDGRLHLNDSRLVSRPFRILPHGVIG